MPSFCSVVNCGMRAERDRVSFYRFPAVLRNRGDHLKALSAERRNAWIKALKRGPLTETQLKYGRVCSRHFINGTPSSLEDKIHPDWVPNQNMGYVSSEQPCQSAASRYTRCEQRKRKKLEVETKGPSCSYISQPESCGDDISIPETQEDISSSDIHENAVSVSVQTDITEKQLCSVFDDLNFCNGQNYELKTKLNILDLNEDAFKNNDAKVLYFTGLINDTMLFGLHSRVSSYLSSHHNNTLSTFQQLLLTLMKLRLNLPFKYLSYRFGVSPTSASKAFYKCIDVLYDRLKCFVNWPSREDLRENACFKETFGNNVAVVIDCFEVFTETPSKVVNVAQCWSNYKHHETVKFLIGITPHGTISYISEAWGGRTSDKFLTENCGFLNLILPGDIVLADRGFLIQESLEIVGAQLKMPAFTKGKTQLHPTDLEATRNIATVRIHVERVIGVLKKNFHIFRETIPVSMLSTSRDSLNVLDKIVVVCSAIINICPSQVPLN